MMALKMDGTVTIERTELARILCALRSVTGDLKGLLDDGFPKPPRKGCSADVGSAYENWWDDKRVALELAAEVLDEFDHLC